ncbi:MAG: hypothetical protein QXH08_00205 [Candidatus Hadarchaeales archaeon]
MTTFLRKQRGMIGGGVSLAIILFLILFLLLYQFPALSPSSYTAHAAEAGFADSNPAALWDGSSNRYFPQYGKYGPERQETGLPELDLSDPETQYGWREVKTFAAQNPSKTREGDDRVWLAYLRLTNETEPLQSTLFVQRSTNGGQTWGNQVQVAANVGEYFDAAYQPDTNRIFFVWSDADGYLRWAWCDADTLSVSASAYLRWNDESPAVGRKPKISGQPGRLHVVYLYDVPGEGEGAYGELFYANACYASISDPSGGGSPSDEYLRSKVVATQLKRPNIKYLYDHWIRPPEGGPYPDEVWSYPTITITSRSAVNVVTIAWNNDDRLYGIVSTDGGDTFWATPQDWTGELIDVEQVHFPSIASETVDGTHRLIAFYSVHSSQDNGTLEIPRNDGGLAQIEVPLYRLWYRVATWDANSGSWIWSSDQGGSTVHEIPTDNSELLGSPNRPSLAFTFVPLVPNFSALYLSPVSLSQQEGGDYAGDWLFLSLRYTFGDQGQHKTKEFLLGSTDSVLRDITMTDIPNVNRNSLTDEELEGMKWFHLAHAPYAFSDTSCMEGDLINYWGLLYWPDDDRPEPSLLWDWLYGSWWDNPSPFSTSYVRESGLFKGYFSWVGVPTLGVEKEQYDILSDDPQYDYEGFKSAYVAFDRTLWCAPQHGELMGFQPVTEDKAEEIHDEEDWWGELGASEDWLRELAWGTGAQETLHSLWGEGEEEAVPRIANERRETVFVRAQDPEVDFLTLLSGVYDENWDITQKFLPPRYSLVKLSGNNEHGAVRGVGIVDAFVNWVAHNKGNGYEPGSEIDLGNGLILRFLTNPSVFPALGEDTTLDGRMPASSYAGDYSPAFQAQQEENKRVFDEGIYSVDIKAYNGAGPDWEAPGTPPHVMRGWVVADGTAPEISGLFGIGEGGPQYIPPLDSFVPHLGEMVFANGGTMIVPQTVFDKAKEPFIEPPPFSSVAPWVYTPSLCANLFGGGDGQAAIVLHAILSSQTFTWQDNPDDLLLGVVIEDPAEPSSMTWLSNGEEWKPLLSSGIGKVELIPDGDEARKAEIMVSQEGSASFWRSYVVGVPRSLFPDADNRFHSLLVRAYDRVGNFSEHNYTFRYTTEAAPTISYSITPSAPDGENGWYITEPSVSFEIQMPPGEEPEALNLVYQVPVTSPFTGNDCLTASPLASYSSMFFTPDLIGILDPSDIASWFGSPVSNAFIAFLQTQLAQEQEEGSSISGFLSGYPFRLDLIPSLFLNSYSNASLSYALRIPKTQLQDLGNGIYRYTFQNGEETNELREGSGSPLLSEMSEWIASLPYDQSTKDEINFTIQNLYVPFLSRDFSSSLHDDLVSLLVGKGMEQDCAESFVQGLSFLYQGIWGMNPKWAGGGITIYAQAVSETGNTSKWERVGDWEQPYKVLGSNEWHLSLRWSAHPPTYESNPAVAISGLGHAVPWLWPSCSAPSVIGDHGFCFSGLGGAEGFSDLSGTLMTTLGCLMGYNSTGVDAGFLLAPIINEFIQEIGGPNSAYMFAALFPFRAMEGLSEVSPACWHYQPDKDEWWWYTGINGWLARPAERPPRPVIWDSGGGGGGLGMISPIDEPWVGFAVSSSGFPIDLDVSTIPVNRTQESAVNYLSLFTSAGMVFGDSFGTDIASLLPSSGGEVALRSLSGGVPSLLDPEWLVLAEQLDVPIPINDAIIDRYSLRPVATELTSQQQTLGRGCSQSLSMIGYIESMLLSGGDEQQALSYLFTMAPAYFSGDGVFSLPYEGIWDVSLQGRNVAGQSVVSSDEAQLGELGSSEQSRTGIDDDVSSSSFEDLVDVSSTSLYSLTSLCFLIYDLNPEDYMPPMDEVKDAMTTYLSGTAFSPAGEKQKLPDLQGYINVIGWDKTPPEIDLGEIGSDFTVQLLVSDNVSGLWRLYYSWDEGPEQLYEVQSQETKVEEAVVPIPLDSNGELTVYAYDWAGNKSGTYHFWALPTHVREEVIPPDPNEFGWYGISLLAPLGMSKPQTRLTFVPGKEGEEGGPPPTNRGISKSLDITQDIGVGVLPSTEIKEWGNLDLFGAAPSGSGWVKVSAQHYHAAALSENGSITLWGYNLSYGELDPPPGDNSGFVDIAVGAYHNVALRSDGTVVAWGDNTYGQCDVPLNFPNPIVAVAAGSNHSLALDSTGRVYAWGANGNGQCNVPDEALSGVVGIEAYGNKNLALKDNGAVVLWGDSFELYWQYWSLIFPNQPNSGFVSATVNDASFVCVREDGSVFEGILTLYPEDDPARLPSYLNHDFVSVASGGTVFLGQKEDGTLVSWGADDSAWSKTAYSPLDEALSYLETDNFSAYWQFSFAGVLAPQGRGFARTSQSYWRGDLTGGDDSGFSQLDVGGGADGYEFVIGLREDGTLEAIGGYYSWGIESNKPSGLFTDVSAGGRHALAVRSDGAAVAWGHNNKGQCNVPPAAQSGVTAVSAGYEHSLALLSNGTVVAWGDNTYGQCNVPSALQGRTVVSVYAGGYHSLALDSTGRVYAWGANWYGQCNVPPSAQSGVVKIYATSGHNLALKSDGSIVAWGDNGYGQCNVPSPNEGFSDIAATRHNSFGVKQDGTVVGWGGGLNLYLPLFSSPSFSLPPWAGSGGGGGGNYELPLDVDRWDLSWDGSDPSSQTGNPVTSEPPGVLGGINTLGYICYVSDGSTIQGDVTVRWDVERPSAQEAISMSPVTPAEDYSGWADPYLLPRLSPSTSIAGLSWVRETNYRLSMRAGDAISGLWEGGFAFWRLLLPVGGGGGGGGSSEMPFGRNSYVAGGTYFSAAISSGEGSIAMWWNDDDGEEIRESLLNWGLFDEEDIQDIMTPPSPNSSFSAVTCGKGDVSSVNLFSLGLKENGEIVGWGVDFDQAKFAQIGIPSDFDAVIDDVPSGSFQAVSLGSYDSIAAYALALTSEGGIVGWGCASMGADAVLEGIPSGTGYLEVFAGSYSGLAIRSDGSLIRWGDYTGVPEGDDFVSLVSENAALRSDGTLVMWVDMPDGSIVTVDVSGYDIRAAAASPYSPYTITCLLSNGRLLLIQEDHMLETDAPWGTEARIIDGGIYHVSFLNSQYYAYFPAILSDGTLACIGFTYDWGTEEIIVQNPTPLLPDGSFGPSSGGGGGGIGELFGSLAAVVNLPTLFKQVMGLPGDPDPIVPEADGRLTSDPFSPSSLGLAEGGYVTTGLFYDHAYNDNYRTDPINVRLVMIDATPPQYLSSEVVEKDGDNGEATVGNIQMDGTWPDGYSVDDIYDISGVHDWCAKAVLEWGENTDYGNQVELEFTIDEQTGAQVWEPVVLTGLDKTKTYHYRFVIYDLAGNVTYSQDRILWGPQDFGAYGESEGDIWLDAGETLITRLEPTETFGTIPTGVISDLLLHTDPDWGPGVQRQDESLLRTEELDYNVSGNVPFLVSVYAQTDFQRNGGGASIPITSLALHTHSSLPGGGDWVWFFGLGQANGFLVAQQDEPPEQENGVDFTFNLRLKPPADTPPGTYSAILVFVAYQP